MVNRAIGIAVTLVVAALGKAAPAQSLTVGSKNFVEQFVVGELYATALEGAGFKIVRRINLGSTPIVHEALRTGLIDLYPEYTGTGLVAIMKAPNQRDADPQRIYETVKAHYEKEFGLTWLKSSSVNNSHAMVVLRETAERLNLRTLSDLARVSSKLTLGAGPDFGNRPDGIAGLRETYGIAFADYQKFPVMRIRYKALQNRKVDVVAGFTTDGNLADDGYVILQDDKALFPPYFLAPAIRIDAAANNPKAVEALNHISALLDNSTMRELNRQVAIKDRNPHQVAVEFLRAHSPRQ